MTPAETRLRARQAAYRRGLSSEVLALALLMLKGYRPLARRFSAAGGEIDLVMRRGRVIVFVEVKARGRLAEAHVAIDGRKQARFSRAVRAWLSRHPPPPQATLRADAVLLARGHWPRHLPDAFPLQGF
ncbi:YraN family protein [Methylobacterium organophilum]|uniref:UPF0102 protein LKMONMHP_0331 n=1 Tax=Methylobacterium organophilum TaxID=410 RepID=A0ABQ4T2P2_METOR|nr:YraN family protein [Methylobacterium organophilum]UMY18976.1 YraN family protein [Methylobacterium organophilum]GJE25493.1 hypothetical protein LKMONMHP_0331 [Methylobacterium organophilum]